MSQLKKFQIVPYLKKIIWQPYNDNNQPEKSMEFEPECAVILSTDAWEELEEVKIKNIQLQSRIKVLQIELAHKNAADSKINFKGDIDGDDINTEIEIIDEYMKNVRPYYESKKAKPDCTGCVRAKGAKPANVYNGMCFECSRPDWCDRDFYEAKGV